MLRKNYFALFLTAVIFLVGSTVAFAQSGMARGTVELKKADGTTTLLPDVVIEIYRLDVQGKLPPGKTNKKGEFTILGLIPGAKYAVAVSAPNIASDVFPNIKAGDEKIKLTVVEGDGKQFTEAQVRDLIAKAPTDAPKGELTAEQKKQLEEQAKQQAKYEAEKKKVDNINEVVGKAVSDGNKAFNEKNYDLAISKYDEGINVDPDFEGSAPILLNNKTSALLERAIAKYNAGVRGDASGKAAAMDAVKKDLTDAFTASNRSLEILKGATSTDAKLQKNYADEKLRAYRNLVNVNSRMFSMNIDTTKGKEALTTLDEYSALETNAEQKGKMQLLLAEGFRQAGDSPNAIVAYRKAMESSPENPDILAGLGLSLFSAGASVTPENTAQMQEGLNLMTRFSEIAPDTHPLKASVKDAVDYLKTKQLTPQKIAKPTKKKT